MKKQITTLLITVICALPIYGFTVSTTNLVDTSSDGALPVVDTSDTQITHLGGVLATGYFATVADGDLATTEFSSLLADFDQLGGSLAFDNSFNIDALFDVSLGDAIGAGSDFIGKSVYIVMGNGSSLATSSELAVFKDSSLTFDEDTNSPGGSVVITPGDLPSGLLVGSIGGPETVSGTTFDNSIILAQNIPEPSVTILGLLGMLGLLRRRR